MSPSRPLLAAIFLPLYACVLVGAGVYFWQNWQEYGQRAAEETQARARLAEAEAKLEAREKILERLRTDPAYVELLIRRRLGYARPDELVFKFDE